MGDKKPASYPVNHDDADENGGSLTGGKQHNVPLHLVYKTLKDSEIPEEKVAEILFRLGSGSGRIA